MLRQPIDEKLEGALGRTLREKLNKLFHSVRVDVMYNRLYDRVKRPMRIKEALKWETAYKTLSTK